MYGPTVVKQRNFKHFLKLLVQPRGVVGVVDSLLEKERWCALVLYADAAAYGGDEL